MSKRKTKVQPKKVVRKVVPLKKVKYNIEPESVKRKPLRKIVHQLNNETQTPEISQPEIIQPEITQPEIKMEIETPVIVEVKTPVSTNEIETISSSSMLDDLMSDTDKDNETQKDDDFIFDDDSLNENKTDSKIESKIDNVLSGEKDYADKLTDTLTTDGDDWQNPSDFRKMCAVNAMMYVEGGAILLSFIGQMISGDWSAEGEKKYTPSEERRKLIRAPLAKKFELNKDHSKRTPTGALITAILFTIIPIVIVAFKDRKNRDKIERQNIENIRLKNDLANANAEMEHLRSVKNTNNTTITRFPTTIIKGRGRHKKDCDCDKCNLKKLKNYA